MNKTMTSLVTLGASAVAYGMMSRNNNLMNNRNLKKMRKQITKAIF